MIERFQLPLPPPPPLYEALIYLYTLYVCNSTRTAHFESYAEIGAVAISTEIRAVPLKSVQ